ncbi:hypothetical protein [Flavobacterium sp. 7A]|uniref:hypothetical protein n=1 Tax=Flavobacterium sp. 7A TaxID=2940571 RepID=UPI002227516E|nr:hypothetical protein [Flavobacterium sp. 7A]MCW2121062.1 hypothetical protein [Flavobacterium sp. 7A]
MQFHYFKRRARILLNEKKLQELKTEEVSKLSDRSQYVNRANKTMHFVRNRLGPISNLVKQIEFLDKVPEEKSEDFRRLILKENERAKIELKNISIRADDMLEKSKNPFVYNTLSDISIARMFTILKQNVSCFFPQLIVSTSIKNLDKKLFVKINEEGFELVLSDWLNNIYKYKNDFVDIHFIIDNEHLNIKFINNHKLDNNNIENLISDLTSTDRNEIMKRTTHGLFILKSTLEDMNIPITMTHNKLDKLLTLTLILKTFKNENSSI